MSSPRREHPPINNTHRHIIRPIFHLLSLFLVLKILGEEFRETCPERTCGVNFLARCAGTSRRDFGTCICAMWCELYFRAKEWETAYQ